MRRFVCTVCGYVYDEAKGIPEAGIAPGTKWENLPDTWTCPLCGASKSEFREERSAAPKAETAPQTSPSAVQAAPVSDLKELSALEISAICSNLARGCEKQYMAEESARFSELAAYFKAGAEKAKDASVEKLASLVDQDLQSGLPAANAAAAGDRGAKRALVWSEKVTRILNSLLGRYAREGEAMLENTGVFVCTICGFVYIGETPPALCPVCKVPSWKFEKIEG